MDHIHSNIALPYSHNPWLVIVSIILAMIASYTALDLVGRVTAARGSARLNWLTGGATVMGSGIWAMHFTAMLAFQVPVQITYDVPTVLVSWTAAIIVSWLALYTASRSKVSLIRLGISGLLMGIGIAAMHYIGMAAIRLEAILSYDPFYFTLSLVIAVTASLAALWLAIAFRSDSPAHWSWAKIISAIVMGFAISGMHFTGMHATILTPAADLIIDTSRAIDISLLGGVAIALVTLMVLGFALLFSIVDQRLYLQGKQLESYVTDLHLVAEISRITTSFLDQKELISAVVRQVQSTFNYYQVGLYLFAENKDKLIFVGGTGEAGSAMIIDEYTVSIGQGLVGRAAASNEVVLVPDVSQEPNWLPNTLLPETQSEVIVPIGLGGEVLASFGYTTFNCKWIARKRC